MNQQQLGWRLLTAGFIGVLVSFWSMSFIFGLVISAAVFAVLALLF
jgi:hypothetical protein